MASRLDVARHETGVSCNCSKDAGSATAATALADAWLERTMTYFVLRETVTWSQSASRCKRRGASVV